MEVRLRHKLSNGVDFICTDFSEWDDEVHMLGFWCRSNEDTPLAYDELTLRKTSIKEWLVINGKTQKVAKEMS